MQKPKPENKRSLTAQSIQLGKNCHDYKYFTLKSEQPLLPAEHLRLQRHIPSLLAGFWPYPTMQPGDKSFNKGKEGFLSINSQPDDYIIPQNPEDMGLVPLRWRGNWTHLPAISQGWPVHLAESHMLSPVKRWQKPSKSHYKSWALKINGVAPNVTLLC